MSRPKKILIIGGSGFIGEAVCNQLAALGHQLTVPTRRLDKAKHLNMLPTCRVVQADIHDRSTLGRLVSGQDAVINLLGVLNSKTGKPYGQQFRINHVEFPKALCTTMIRHGVKRLVHISALGVGVQNPAPSMYLRSKTDGEAQIKDSGLQWTILRPSVVFGPKDQFLNTFACLSQTLPIIALAGAKTKFQPVGVNDVGLAVTRCIEDTEKFSIHSTFDLAGPEIFTLEALFRIAAKASGKCPTIVNLPNAPAKALALFLKLLPGTPLLTCDQINSMKIDSVHNPSSLRFPLETWQSLQQLAPQWIRSRYQITELDRFRQSAHRQG